MAEEQVRGRGRRGRQWLSPPPGAGLLFTVLLRPRVSRDPSSLTLVGGLAAVRAARRWGIPLELKWPNDLLLGGRKCGGVLGETEGEAVLRGVGVNVSSPPPGMEEASCLWEGARVDREEYLAAWREEFLHLYRRWKEGGFGELRKEYVSFCSLLGKEVEVLVGEMRRKGKVNDIGSEGELLLSTGVVRVGEVARVIK
jgi:BirA family biotin operon repressor/biotin-[acetyl-CoA-carboxylase] ligase